MKKKNYLIYKPKNYIVTVQCKRLTRPPEKMHRPQIVQTYSH